jgi:hypothetical protein
LHYEFRAGGEQRNPLTVALPGGEPLSPALRVQFAERTAPAAAQLALARTLSVATSRFERIARRDRPLRELYAGVMSGTSLDGVDAGHRGFAPSTASPALCGPQRTCRRERPRRRNYRPCQRPVPMDSARAMRAANCSRRTPYADSDSRGGAEAGVSGRRHRRPRAVHGRRLRQSSRRRLDAAAQQPARVA